MSRRTIFKGSSDSTSSCKCILQQIFTAEPESDALNSGASTGPEVEDRWADLDMIATRAPHQVGKNIAKGINAGRINFADTHLSHFAQDLEYGFYTKTKRPNSADGALDWAIVEATAIKEDGSIVPGASVGAAPEMLRHADKIVIEVNTALPNMEGLHDMVHTALPPLRQPYVRICRPTETARTTAKQYNLVLAHHSPW